MTLGRLRRKSRTYDGTETTSRQMRDILPFVTGKMAQVAEKRGEAVLAIWPLLVGERIASMSEATSFVEGVLSVRVKSSTLYSLLVQQEKRRLLLALREKFPDVTIKTILFRMG